MSHKADGVGHIILNRPPANSYDRAFLDDLSAQIDDCRFDPEVRSIVIESASERLSTGKAPAFRTPPRLGSLPRRATRG